MINENELIKLYKEGNSTNKIAEIVGLSQPTVAKYLKKNNIILKTQSQSARKYEYDETFFSYIDTPEKAYMLGFIFADGSNSYNLLKNSFKVKIAINEKDIDILNKFNILMKSNRPIYKFVQSNSYGISSMISLVFPSKRMSNDLLSLGVSNDKTSTEVYPIISSPLNIHFIRGYFDGDGCIWFDKNGNPKIEILATESFCISIQSILSQFSIESRINTKHKFIYRVRINKKEHVRCFLNLIYSNSSIHLDRKFNLARSFI